MVLLVIGASFCGIGVVLWIAVGGVVDNHTNHGKWNSTYITNTPFLLSHVPQSVRNTEV